MVFLYSDRLSLRGAFYVFPSERSPFRAEQVAFVLFGGADGSGRFLTYSLSPGTFYGRLLYYRDALPVILKHPLGLGYLGYFETQGSFQTGVYTVMHVHNDLLQIFLDAGWLPGILCIVSFVRMLTGGAKKKGAEHRLPLRMIVTVIVLHSLLDFDLQFVSVVFVLLLCMADLSPEKELYKQTGDDESAEYCLKKMQAIPEMMEEVREGTSFFGWRIKDKPVF